MSVGVVDKAKHLFYLYYCCIQVMCWNELFFCTMTHFFTFIWLITYIFMRRHSQYLYTLKAFMHHRIYFSLSSKLLNRQASTIYHWPHTHWVLRLTERRCERSAKRYEAFCGWLCDLRAMHITHYLPLSFSNIHTRSNRWLNRVAGLFFCREWTKPSGLKYSSQLTSRRTTKSTRS